MSEDQNRRDFFRQLLRPLRVAVTDAQIQRGPRATCPHCGVQTEYQALLAHLSKISGQSLEVLATCMNCRGRIQVDDLKEKDPSQ